jgi:MFS superfamily sulfate permease-like transporter
LLKVALKHQKSKINQVNKYISIKPKNDILSGLTVALALVPEAVAFALLAGVDPLIGLYAATLPQQLAWHECLHMGRDDLW